MYIVHMRTYIVHMHSHIHSYRAHLDIHIYIIHTHAQIYILGGEDARDALSCRPLSAKEPLIMGPFHRN